MSSENNLDLLYEATLLPFTVDRNSCANLQCFCMGKFLVCFLACHMYDTKVSNIADTIQMHFSLENLKLECDPPLHEYPSESSWYPG